MALRIPKILDDLLDVSASTPSEGQALVYSSASAVWISGNARQMISGSFTASVGGLGRLLSLASGSSERAYFDASGLGWFSGGLSATAPDSANGSVIARFGGGSLGGKVVVKTNDGSQTGGGYLGSPFVSAETAGTLVVGSAVGAFLLLPSNLLFGPGVQSNLSSDTASGTVLGNGGNTALYGMVIRLGSDTTYRGPLYVRDGNNLTDWMVLGNARSAVLRGGVVDGPAAVGVVLDTSASLTSSGARLVSVRTSGTERSAVTKDGVFATSGTSTSVPGDATLNAGSGRFVVPAGSASVTISSSAVSTASDVFVVLRTADATGQVRSVVPSAGYFVVNLAAPTNNATASFMVFNG